MNMTTLLYGDPGLIRDEFVNEVSQVHYRVSDMARDWRDVATDLRVAAAGMVTALCMSTAREFRIFQRGSCLQTLVVWAKGPEGWAMSADEVEYARTFRERGDAWETLAGILIRGEKESVRNWPGNQVEDLRVAGLDGIIDDLSEPGTVMVLDSSEPMSSSPGAFTLLFGGSGEDWGGWISRVPSGP